MFLHPQLFQESCCNVRDSGLARACVMDLYLESDEPYQLRRLSQRGGHHSSQQGNATSAILVGRAGMF